jgi:glycosyltransferase involved in cell wall biosynthesis
MNRSLRILQVADFYKPFIGGMEQHVETLSRQLARRGHEVTVATAQLPGTVQDEISDGVTIRRMASWSSAILAGHYQRSSAPFHPPIPDPGMIAGLHKIIDEFRPHIVHAHGWITYSCLAAAARRRRFGLVVTMHDYGFVCARRSLLRDGRALCEGPQLNACLRCAPGQYGSGTGIALALGLRASRPWHSRVDSWIAISRFVADANRQALPRGCGVAVIPPSSAQPSALGRLPSWLPGRGYLLFVGALGSHKGLHWLLDAYSSGQVRLPLVILGTPAADTPSTWPPGVVVRTDVPHNEVIQAWQHAGIGLVPSKWPEPFGLVAVEAMRSGVPVVASRVGALPEIVTDEITGILVTPGDTSELAVAVRRINDDPALRREMSSASVIRAEQFGADIVTTAHEELYHRTLSKRSLDTLNAAAGGK